MASRAFLAISLAAAASLCGFTAPVPASIGAGTKSIALFEMTSGVVSLTRAGAAQPAPGPGDLLFNGDLIRTGEKGRAVIAIDRASGFSGTLTINSSSTVYISTNLVKEQPRTSLDLMTGSVSSKITKLAGTPGMVVSTGDSAFAVRGTEFEIAVSVNESILAICLEGMIAVAADRTEKNLGPGLAIDRKVGATFARLDVPTELLQGYRDAWITEEIAAFRSNPLKALAGYEQRYTDNVKLLLADAKALAGHPVVKKWIAELRAGSPVNPFDPQVLREKKEVAPLILALAKRLSVFERVYWRLEEVSALVKGSSYERAELRRGLRVDRFLATVAENYVPIGNAILDFRQAEQLYLQRNPDSAGLEGIGQGGDSFFSEQDSGQ